jgi:hypothetical protein
VTAEALGEILGYASSTVFYILVLSVPLFMFLNLRRPDKDVSNQAYLVLSILYFLAMPQNLGNFLGLVVGWLVYRQIVKFVKARKKNG